MRQCKGVCHRHTPLCLFNYCNHLRKSINGKISVTHSSVFFIRSYKTLCLIIQYCFSCNSNCFCYIIPTYLSMGYSTPICSLIRSICLRISILFSTGNIRLFGSPESTHLQTSRISPSKPFPPQGKSTSFFSSPIVTNNFSAA